MPPKKEHKLSLESRLSAPRFHWNVKWSSGDDAALLDSLKTFSDGNSADNGTFKYAAFTAAAKALKDSHKSSGGAPKTAKSCSRRWGTLKANCLVVQKLRELSGFGWDEMRKIVIASDKVWDDYLEAHPEAKVWRSTPFPLYDDIIVLVDGCHATGEGALHIGYEMSPPWPSTLLDDEDDVFVGEDVLGGNPESESVDEKVSIPVSHTPRVPKHGRAPSVSPTSTGVHKKCSNVKLTGPAAILGVADALESVATSFTAPTSFLDDVPSTPKRRINAIQAVCTDASLSSDERAKVVALFTKDVAIADAYTAISDVSLRSMYIRLELEK
ncbi:hypothetical protein DFJ58DRAFT_714945 [Suillus subalutaceus]|uniref:uncharacterized protein n=1 Tax=Suillus subalutaceus TaxID=48586 RepID=UPI001B860B37|nr:uncharacterized protein DFJ58DRAFT_714945 [Suillus subalutaceus]KAG1864778.1 hypothetical protein DFJ58DRAFT_714945 [Suillus subalutaceus]